MAVLHLSVVVQALVLQQLEVGEPLVPVQPLPVPLVQVNRHLLQVDLAGMGIALVSLYPFL